MKKFSDDFKLYAYKKYDINDLSFLVSDNFVLSYRLTHSEIEQIFKGAWEKQGIKITISHGTKIYCVVKKSIDSVRFTISAAGCNFNLRYSIYSFNKLIENYRYQLANPVDWDDYDPR